MLNVIVATVSDYPARVYVPRLVNVALMPDATLATQVLATAARDRSRSETPVCALPFVIISRVNSAEPGCHSSRCPNKLLRLFRNRVTYELPGLRPLTSRITRLNAHAESLAAVTQAESRRSV